MIGIAMGDGPAAAFRSASAGGIAATSDSGFDAMRTGPAAC